jgi:hypothetical protein
VEIHRSEQINQKKEASILFTLFHFWNYSSEKAFFLFFGGVLLKLPPAFASLSLAQASSDEGSFLAMFGKAL